MTQNSSEIVIGALYLAEANFYGLCGASSALVWCRTNNEHLILVKVLCYPDSSTAYGFLNLKTQERLIVFSTEMRLGLFRLVAKPNP